ncbi:integral membrane protein [Rhodococcus sp. 27YEA15]
MGRMANVFDLSTTAKRFRFVAILEAFTWLGLLIGMAFKYIPDNGSEIGVKVFGPIHGVVFVAYVAVAILTAVKLRWSVITTLWALFASIPPFGTVVFEVWASRTGKMAELSTSPQRAGSVHA